MKAPAEDNAWPVGVGVEERRFFFRKAILEHMRFYINFPIILHYKFI